MHSKRHQRGITLSGLIYACIILGIAALFLMRLFPLYNEKLKVDFAMNKVLETPNAGKMTKRDIIKVMQRQFEVSDVDRWNDAELAKILDVKPLKNGAGKSVSLNYEIRGPLVGELDIVLTYDKQLMLKKAAAE